MQTSDEKVLSETSGLWEKTHEICPKFTPECIYKKIFEPGRRIVYEVNDYLKLKKQNPYIWWA